ncbi:hypothetical protein [Flavobacterium sp. B183]|uniref:hypothetical protein n=1 Tax=Flavobacterium sp. B183 TaxID=907046 RepID=UPI00201E84FD|nr:hypothetical protein [Flavobacterium sp. B183]URC11982.1 hypothetical protein M4I44_18045 [Flavobacterium sp. B183]
MSKSYKIQIYFYSILIISIIWLFIFPKPIKNFAPIIFGIPTFPVFIFNFRDKLEDFSRALKNTLPDLFQKYVVDYGVSADKGEIVDIGLLSKNADFDNLKDVELYEIYILCKQSIRLAFISFWIIALLGIATVYL